MMSQPDEHRQQDHQRPGGEPAPGNVPNEDAVEEEFPHAEDVPLREQRDLHDETGDDIRQYTGEPVPTTHGHVTPEQMAAGRDAVVGGGEHPDAPPRGPQPDPDPDPDPDDEPAARRRDPADGHQRPDDSS